MIYLTQNGLDVSGQKFHSISIIFLFYFDNLNFRS